MPIIILTDETENNVPCCAHCHQPGTLQGNTPNIDLYYCVNSNCTAPAPERPYHWYVTKSW